MTCLQADFFNRDARQVAEDLIGCTFLCDGVGGMIVETEAYRANDPACHAYRGLTERTKVLFGPPAKSYVYFSYGMHNLLNFVAEPKGHAAAVLIRALQPLLGLEQMIGRRQQHRVENLCSGPGKLTQALGITLDDNDRSLLNGRFMVEQRPHQWRDLKVVRGPRIGISHATKWPWRYSAADNRFVSQPRPDVS